MGANPSSGPVTRNSLCAAVLAGKTIKESVIRSTTLNAVKSFLDMTSLLKLTVFESPRVGEQYR
jgi:hypothetical protein